MDAPEYIWWCNKVQRSDYVGRILSNLRAVCPIMFTSQGKAFCEMDGEPCDARRYRLVEDGEGE